MQGDCKMTLIDSSKENA